MPLRWLTSVVRIIGRLVIISLGVSSMIATALGQTNSVVRETPAQIVDADRWLGTNSELQGEQLAAVLDFLGGV